MDTMDTETDVIEPSDSDSSVVVSGSIKVQTDNTNEDALIIDLAKMLYANTNFDNTELSAAQLAKLAIGRAKTFVEALK